MTRLYEAAKILNGITGQTDVARALNTSPQTVNNWEARGISKAGMLTAQLVFGVSATWLDDGQGEMAVRPVPAAFHGQPVEMVDDNDTEGMMIRMATDLRLEAGIVGLRTDSDYGTASHRIERRWAESNGYRRECLVAIRVKGESMEPRINEDDIVVINTADTKLVDGAVFAINYEGEAMIKRMQRDLGQWWLSSDNPDKSRFPRKMCMLRDDCVIVGRVVQLVSNTI